MDYGPASRTDAELLIDKTKSPSVVWFSLQ